MLHSVCQVKREKTYGSEKAKKKKQTKLEQEQTIRIEKEEIVKSIEGNNARKSMPSASFNVNIKLTNIFLVEF